MRKWLGKKDNKIAGKSGARFSEGLASSSLQNQEWYQALIEDCEAIIIETEFTARWALVEGYHALGERILEENDNFERVKIYGEEIVSRVTISLGKSHRTIYRAIQFAKMFPDLNKVPGGKAVSWHKICNELLPAPKEEKSDIPLPEGKYNVIYADPPWDIGSIVLEKWESPLDDKYPTMTLEELKKLRIDDLSADDCVCFMWSTLSTLPQALELLESWGFQYHIILTWDKGGGWSANGFHRRTELVLVGYKGSLGGVIKQQGEYIPTIFYETKTIHSAKPQKMYEYLERRTNGKKIELFARNKREGWDVWGNEI